jgi:glycosyltransferase involved in cell wall biosynthesis
MNTKISACLIVYNEAKLIERCLQSIKNLADEIIVVHDGECTDQTLEIARKYTDKIFVKPHVGIAEPIRSFSYQTAIGVWILQIDADEYFDECEVEKIKLLTNSENCSAYNFKWELFDGQKPVYFPGLQKMCLFKKSSIKFQGLPQKMPDIEGKVCSVDIFLRHRPLYENISWAMANKKRKYWLASHVKYYFPELVQYECFNTTSDSWIEYTKKVKQHPLIYLILYPVKNLLGQLKNGLWRSRIGVNIALQQYVYYFSLYRQVWKMNRKLKSR